MITYELYFIFIISGFEMWKKYWSSFPDYIRHENATESP